MKIMKHENWNTAAGWRRRLAALFLAALLPHGAGVASRGQTPDGAPPAAAAPAEAEAPDQGTNAPAGKSNDGGTSVSVSVTSNSTIPHYGPFTLDAAHSTPVIINFGGPVKVHGKVDDAVIVFFGDAEVDGGVGDAVVSILGNIHLRPGARVKDSVVAVMGNIVVDDHVQVNGDAVAVGGNLEVAEGAKIQGQRQGIPLPFVEQIKDYLTDCVLKLRPMSPRIGWVWAVAGFFFLFYLLVAAAFQDAVRKCVDELESRALATLLFGLLAKFMIPILAVILACTGIGILVVPFLSLGAILAQIVGKVALLQWVGGRIGRQSGVPLLQKPLVGFVIGWLILTAFYNIWGVGFLSFMVFSVWGLGVGVTAVIAAFRRSRRAAAARVSGPLPPPPAGFPPATPPPTLPTGGDGGQGLGSVPVPPPLGTPSVITPPRDEAIRFPRAGFWERMGAGFLDLMVVAIANGFLAAIFPAHFFVAPLLAVAYFTFMWSYRGSTVGGIVFNLKVVRIDGTGLTRPVALVRALGSVLSMMVFFLGFFCILWDDERQAWHDRIAGTVVVRVPRMAPLVCY